MEQTLAERLASHMNKILLTLLILASCGASLPASAAAGKADSLNLEKAVFAGGCFWCMQEPFDKVKGVVSTVVGYTGGREESPTYEQVSAGKTGHRESIEVTFDPSVISFDEVLNVFWKHINPTQADGQFSDIAHQYTTAIFYLDAKQKEQAEASKERLGKSGKFAEPIATEIVAASRFWPAEEYHQKYYLKNPEHYESYHVGSGRVKYLKETWGSAE